MQALSAIRAGVSSVGAGLLLQATPAHADPSSVGVGPRVHAYAVVVGDDLGGPGQGPLRFAEDDAHRVGDVLREIGHFDANDVRLLLRPNAQGLLAAVDDVVARARANADRGESSEILFYFSGHARASALNLGVEELPVTTLRDRLRAPPSTLTIVVLDACQSGAFARVKGAEPAADFSYNSVSSLTQKGLAVMASSTSEELSQESEELKGSFFTHHLVTGLRGAGDTDGDGRVSLDEAYRYAYRRTLASTARTRVGGQHVTLETDLAGQGEVPVTYPAEAKAQLELPTPLDARILVQHQRSGAVVAEVQKAPGAPVRLAFVRGDYVAVVRQSQGIVECRFALSQDRVTQLDPTRCTPVVAEKAAAKGEQAGAARSLREIDRWAIDAALGGTSSVADAYTARLQDFGYSPDSDASGRVSLGVSRILTPHLAAVLQATTLASDSFRRFGTGAQPDSVSMSAWGTALCLRAYTDIWGTWLGVYGQAGAGVTLGVVDYHSEQTGVPPSGRETYAGYLLSGAVGVTARLSRRFSLFLLTGYDHAPAIHNLLGDSHDSGGVSLALGLRLHLGDDR